VNKIFNEAIVFKLFSKKSSEAWDPSRLPKHIAIIMDGNGRWAAKRALPRTAGHAAGAETFRRVATYCKDIGIEYLTVYAFSTENWSRPPDEINSIMELLDKYLREALIKMERDKVKMKFLGDMSVLSPGLQKLIAETEELSKKFDGVQVNICVNYGSRAEILRAVEKYVTGENGTGGRFYCPPPVPMSHPLPPSHPLPLSHFSEEEFSKYLYTDGIPDPDLIIRPSGEMRISNFLLWQSAYSEFYFTDTLWPDFGEKELDRAIIEFQKRERRFGDVKAKENAQNHAQNPGQNTKKESTA